MVAYRKNTSAPPSPCGRPGIAPGLRHGPPLAPSPTGVNLFTYFHKSPPSTPSHSLRIGTKVLFFLLPVCNGHTKHRPTPVTLLRVQHPGEGAGPCPHAPALGHFLTSVYDAQAQHAGRRENSHQMRLITATRHRTSCHVATFVCGESQDGGRGTRTRSSQPSDLRLAPLPEGSGLLPVPGQARPAPAGRFSLRSQEPASFPVGVLFTALLEMTAGNLTPPHWSTHTA